MSARVTRRSARIRSSNSQLPSRSSARRQIAKPATNPQSEAESASEADFTEAETQAPVYDAEPVSEASDGENVATQETDADANEAGRDRVSPEADQIDEQAVLEELTPQQRRLTPAVTVATMQHNVRSHVSVFQTQVRQGRQSAPTSSALPSSSSALSHDRRELSRPEQSRKSLPNITRHRTQQFGVWETDSEAQTNTGSRATSRSTRHSHSFASGEDRSLGEPSIEERLVTLSSIAKGVLRFYFRSTRWTSESLDDLQRNWTPFEAYKTHQLLTGEQYSGHFIDIEELGVLPRLHGHSSRDRVEDAIRSANCATFLHYCHQYHMQARQYNRQEGRSVTARDVAVAGLRNVNELDEARKSLLVCIVPFHWPLTDDVLNMLLNMSIQVYIYQAQDIVEAVKAGECSSARAEYILDDQLSELMSGDVVRNALQRVRKERQASRPDIEQAARRYETFSNIRQTQLRALSIVDQLDQVKAAFSFQTLRSDLTNYVYDVVRKVNEGTHSVTLSEVSRRTGRISSHLRAPSDAYESSATETEDQRAPPTQSTPRASFVNRTRPAQATDRRYMYEVPSIRAANVSRPRDRNLSRTARRSASIDLSVSQKLAELEDLTDTESAMTLRQDGAAESFSRSQRIAILDEFSDEDEEASELEDEYSTMVQNGREDSVDLGQLFSSPPRSRSFRTRLSEGKPSASSSVSKRRYEMTSEQSGESTAHTGNGAPDSPLRGKEMRLGFNSRNQIVQLPVGAHKVKRLLDAEGAVREMHFDSQTDDFEDVFLDAAALKRNKGKGRAVDSNAQMPSAARVTKPVRAKRTKEDPRTPVAIRERSVHSRTTSGAQETPTQSSKQLPEPGQRPRSPEIDLPSVGDDEEPEGPATDAEAAIERATGTSIPSSQIRTASGRIKDVQAHDDDEFVDPREERRTDATRSNRESSAATDDSFLSEYDAIVVAERKKRAAAAAASKKRAREQAIQTQGPLRTQARETAASSHNDRPAQRQRTMSEQQDRGASVTSQDTRAESSARRYIVGNGTRVFWSDEELNCLMSAIHELLPFKESKRHYQMYKEILDRHGKDGSISKILAHRTNVQIKDKVRNEATRLRRAGEDPRWAQLLDPQKNRPTTAATQSAERRSEEWYAATRRNPEQAPPVQPEQSNQNSQDNTPRRAAVPLRNSPTPTPAAAG